MNLDTLRQQVLARLADGTLPRQLHISQVTCGILTNRCAVCDGRQTHMCYGTSHGAFAFHERCHAIWNEEVAKTGPPH